MSVDQSRQHTVPDRRLLRQNVFERLHADIIDGSLEPGRRLRDNELTSLFGVSRTPLREAVARLEELGLVHTAPNRFTRVAPLATEAIFEALDVLEALAPLLSILLVERLDEDALLEAEYLARRIERLESDDAVGAMGLLLRFAQQQLSDLELIPAITETTLTRLIRYVRQRPGVLAAAGGTPPITALTATLSLRDPDRTTRAAVVQIDGIRAAIRASWDPRDLDPAVSADTAPA
ncbi:GntR family transcriptional regulator [Plantibacter flavus]|uniref:GntR family transcriptional regulator n=1 Tax=Plantibacter flavus TaxID=150123 RepID=UPI003F17BF4C